jgi:hypothetical protein
MKIPLMLRRREMHGNKPSTATLAARDFYRVAMHPNHTFYNIQTPHVAMRKFTPDGKVFIVNACMRSLLLLTCFPRLVSCLFFKSSACRYAVSVQGFQWM